MSQPENWVAVAGVFTTIVVTVWTTAKVYLRKLELEHGVGMSQLPSGVESRLERIEQAVEAVAMEVERVAEGQRFATRLLAERASPLHVPHAGVPVHLDTPH